MLPFEFVMAGPPMSAQTHHREKLIDWKLRVGAAAAARWQGDPFRGKVFVVVTYYHQGLTARLDADNMVKPILDALSGIVYHDDRQASHIEVRSINFGIGYEASSAELLFVAEFAADREFLHVRVEEER
jgi:crossover junction endodeoxyribonuclease RusA